jgi:hypothetical protein
MEDEDEEAVGCWLLDVAFGRQHAAASKASLTLFKTACKRNLSTYNHHQT